MRKIIQSTSQFVLLSLFMVCCLISGCQTVADRDPAFAPIRPALPPMQQQANGSIYQVGTELRLYEDLKARRIGDILTVNLVESTTASKSAGSSVEKTNATSITNPTILGTSAQVSVPGFVPLASTNDLSLATTLNSSNEFEGSGRSNQDNSLSGRISVTVVEVYPNGNMVVRGEKRLTLNNGNEYIRVSGIVRPVDIQSDNSILSTQIADATIMYTGDGEIASASIMGWLARFFVSAFFPF